MWTIKFDPAEREVWVSALLHGPLGARRVSCLWDPGASMTIVNTPVLDSLGYSAKMGKTVRHLTGPGGQRLPGYTLDVRLDIFDEVLDPQEILAQDVLPEHLGVEVLLGMDLVPGRIFILDGVRGTFSVTREGTGAP